MPVRVGINGFGRIGRFMLRASLLRQGGPQIVAINDLNDPAYLAYQFKYDSAHGKWQGDVSSTETSIIIDGQEIQITNSADPAQCQWGQQEVQVVADCTGRFLSTELAQGHLQAGAQKVILSAPAKDQGTPTFVYGVNHQDLTADMDVISNASCTTNALAPVAHIVHSQFGIEEGLMTTIHAVTASQPCVDNISKKDWRGGRAAGNNIIPSSTGAAKAVGLVIPELNGRLTGMAFRVPTINVSVVDLTIRTAQATTYEEINQALLEASQQGPLAGVLGWTNEAVVSTDFMSDNHSSTFDSTAGMGMGPNFFKLVTWYDNEFGYATRMVDMAQQVAEVNGFD